MSYFQLFLRSKSHPLEVVRTKTLHSKCNASIFANPKFISSSRDYTASSIRQSNTVPSDSVSTIVDKISGLTLLEVADLTEVLRKKLSVTEMPILAVMMPGVGFGGLKGGGGKGSGGAKGDEVKVEKTSFDLKLEAFDAATKIKVIKEVRAFTDLGLKEAKDLVEKTHTLLKKGVTKDEAEKIIAKMKELGAKVSMG